MHKLRGKFLYNLRGEQMVASILRNKTNVEYELLDSDHKSLLVIERLKGGKFVFKPQYPSFTLDTTQLYEFIGLLEDILIKEYYLYLQEEKELENSDDRTSDSSGE